MKVRYRHGKVTPKRKLKKTFCFREFNIYLKNINSDESQKHQKGCFEIRFRF